MYEIQGVQTSVFIIDLVTVFDAILTSRQTREKLQCLYENLISNNFPRTAVQKNIWFVNYSFTPKDSTEKKLRALHTLEDLEALFKLFYTFVCEKVPGKITDKYMENLKQACGEI